MATQKPEEKPQNTGLPPVVSAGKRAPQGQQQAQTQQNASQPEKQGLDALSLGQLVDLRRKIDKRLPSLKGVNMERELVAQLAIVKKLQSDTIDDEETPLNQRAQVAGQVENIMSTLGKLQVQIYDSERLKRLEGVLIECLQHLPTEVQEEFLTRYEAEIT